MSKVRTPEPDGFLEFWTLWRPYMRRTDGRGDARDTYRKHILNGADPADIIDGAKAFLRELPEKDRPYIPLAASWLNKEAYADWCDRERTFQAHMAAKANQSTNVVSIAAPRGQTAFLREWDQKQKAKQG